jgi:hypothetical protein
MPDPNPSDPLPPEQTPSVSPELAAIIAALGLTPAEGETEVSQDAILAKIQELVASVDSAQATASNLAAAQAELEKVRGEYQVLFEREEAARKKVEEAAADEILAQYEGRITTPEAKASLRNLLLIDREAGLTILKGLPAAAVAPVSDAPPKPVHTPPGKEPGQQMTEEQKLAEQNKLIAELRKSRPDVFKTYEAAYAELQRTRPELFA